MTTGYSQPGQRQPWFATLPGYSQFFRPSLILPRAGQRLSALCLHFGLGFFAFPFWLRDLTRSRENIRRVLFVGRYHLGDFLMFAPALRLARQQLPDAWFGVVIQDQYARDLDFRSVANAAVSNLDESRPFFRQVSAWRRRFRDLEIDCVVFHRFTRPDLPAAIAAILEGVPHRIGGADKGVQALLTFAYMPRNRERVVEHHLRLVSSWFGLAVVSSPPIWPRLIPGDSPSIAYDVLIAPFAQHSKIWPVDSWHTLLNEFHARGLRIALSAPANLATTANDLLASHPEVTNLAPVSLGLRDLFAAVRRSRSVITVDTGIRHVAAMLGVPCVVIGHGREHRQIMDAYVPSERYVWHAVPCAPCGAEPCPLGHLACIRGTTPATVLEAWTSLNLPPIPSPN